jgi:hypothetical protein
VAPVDEPLPPQSDAGATEPSASRALPSDAPTRDPKMEDVNQYLWDVYERSTTKRDGSGDFTWKDVAAAARLGMTLGDYVIVGMDADFREILYRAGRAMDAAGFRWTILSAFRDDYRQGLAAGYRAHIGNSLHGGSIATGGYGHGCAVDVNDADGRSVPLWQWLDANAAQINVERPLPGLDPAHMQPRGPWHEVAAVLRSQRHAQSDAHGAVTEAANAAAVERLADVNALPPSEADMACIGLHHRRQNEPETEDLASRPQRFSAAARAHVGKVVATRVKETRADTRLDATIQPKVDLKGTGKLTERAIDAGKSAPRKASTHELARHALHSARRAAGPA